MPNFCLINKKEVVVVVRGGKGGGGGWDWWAKPECQNLQQTPPSDGVARQRAKFVGEGVHHSTSRSPQFSNIRSLYAIYSI